MKRRRFSKEQIIAISPVPFHGWKSRQGGLEVSEAGRLRTPGEENGRLRKRLAEAMPAPSC